MKKSCLLIIAVLFCTVSMAQKADDLLGVYRATSPFNDDTAHIKITRADDGTYKGLVVWTNHPTNPDGTKRNDAKNKDKSLRSRTWDQVYLCWNLKYDDGEWVKGNLYDPYSGNTFGVKVKRAKNGKDMSARYYKGVPAVGITTTWKRIK